MTLDILGLQRSGELVVLSYAFTVDSTSTRPQRLWDWVGGTWVEPRLVDGAEMKLHEVVRAGSQRLATDSAGSPRFGAGETFYGYAVFAAPPESTTTMDILFDGAPGLTNIPIQ